MGRLIRRQNSANEDDSGGFTLVLPGLPTRTTSTTTSTSLTSTATTSTTTSSASTTTSTSTTTTSTQTGATTTSTSSTVTTTSTTSTSTTTTPTPSTTSESILVINQSQQTSSTTTEVAKPSTTVVVENQTVTRTPQTSTSAIPGQAGAAKSSFLENKVASGIVFGLCGLVGLLLVLFVIWFAMRKRRRIAKLEKEIISFDPQDVGNFRHHRTSDVDRDSINSAEKGNFGRSNSSLDHYAGNGYATTLNVDSGDYRNAAPYSDHYHIQRNGSIQRPGNAAFNPMAGTGNAGTYALPSQTYMLPSQNFNR